MNTKKTSEKKNEIIVYQPNETLRLEVQLDGDTVWLTQSQMAELFGCTVRNIRLHLENIYACGELLLESTRKDFFLVRTEGSRRVTRKVTCYNLDAIISVGYRVNSVLGVRFRQWATNVLKEYLLRGYSVNSHILRLEDRINRRLSQHDHDIVELQDKVDFFVQTSLPPVQGVFYNGQVFDAHVFAAKHVLSAKKSILLIDSWVDVVTLELLAKKAKGVSVELVTTPRGDKLSPSDITTFNEQYGGLTVRTSRNFHDRYLIVDDRVVYLFGASLKYLGCKCFCAMKVEGADVSELKARI